MTWVRSLLFTGFFFLWTGIMTLSVPLVAPLPRRWMQRLVRLWGQGTQVGMKVFAGLNYRVAGVENVPDGPCIIASKHQSAWDTLIFHVLLPDPCFVVKKELTRIPFWGLGFRKAGSIPVDREGGARALKQMTADARAALERGSQLVIFPEGTRTAPGDQAPYHPGTAAIYRGAAVPVVPVALNSGLFWGRLSFLKRPGTITLRYMEPISPGLPRREFMARLEAAIETGTREITDQALAEFPALRSVYTPGEEAS